jgi:flavin reductase (DIM6/NTAB) family NADH-FMN oxidoreductase RutF
VSDDSAFHRIVARLDYPMFVLTVADGDERSGCLIGFATQVSIDPARYLACVSKKNHTFGVAERSRVFVLHVPRVTDTDIATRFGELTGDEVDKFATVAWTEGPEGVPVLDRLDWFAGRVVDRVDAGDHVGYVLDVLDAGRADHADEPQLGFQAVRDLHPGHEA